MPEPCADQAEITAERGTASLREPANIERLQHGDAAANTQINERITKLSGREAGS
jgi:hypothetical protein